MTAAALADGASQRESEQKRARVGEQDREKGWRDEKKECWSGRWEGRREQLAFT